jgi:predicted nuclease of predicted toxin-antitoxin system
MPQVPKFHLDESVTTAVAAGLRLRNRDCTTTRQAGLLGAGDEQQLAFATGESRVIITADQDFLRLASQRQDHAGIIFWTMRRHFGKLITDIDVLCFQRTAEDFRGTVTYL